MLVLTRKVGQKIRIGESVVIEVLQFKGRWVKISIEAPREIPVVRDELPCRTAEEFMAMAGV